MSNSQDPTGLKTTVLDLRAGATPSAAESQETLVLPGAGQDTPAQGTKVPVAYPEGTVLLDGSAPACPAADQTLIMPPEGSPVRGVAANPAATLLMDGSSPAKAAADQTFIMPPERNPEATLLMDGSSPVKPTADKTLIMSPERDQDATVKISPDSVGPTDSSAGGQTAGSAGAAAGAVSIPGYRILGELGRGGMGVVYKARQVGLNRTVALKMIIAGGHASPEQLLRFQAEAEAVGQLQHPNIVQVYDIGKHEGLPYFSLEFVDGKPLDKDLEAKPQPEQRAAELLETLARAMHYAHERGIIHRDLKPANVLLTKTGIPKISDFGLAKQLESDSSQTKTGTIMGTPSYMAPEQGRGEKQIGHLADVYALGSMLYELITGRPPFLAATALKTLMRLLNEEPVPPSRVQPGVSRDLETICMKCLQKDPARRYETAGVLAEDLRRFQNGEAILARRVSRAERAWRWCKRNPRMTALSGAVAVLLITVAVTLSLMALRMSHDRAAIAETRKQAEERWEQATAAVSAGGFRRARDLLLWSDPLLSTAPDLANVREKLDELRTQIAAFTEFRDLLDRVRYLGLFGEANTPKALEASHKLIALYNQIEKHAGPGRHGWPPLNSQQHQLLQEDIFDALLVSSMIERSVALASPDKMKLPGATRLAIDMLNRAETLLPPTKALFVWRGGYQEKLGDKEAMKAEFERGAQIEPTSAVDRFWHAFADYSRAEEALGKKDNKSAANSYRLAAIGFAKVIEVRPENFWAHFCWANCLPRLGDGYGAVVGYTNCIQIRPDVPWPYKNRGAIHFDLGERDLALADFDKAVGLSPEDATILALRGEYFARLKEFAHAKADFTASLKLQPSDMGTLRNRAVVSMLGKDLEESLADWQELAKRLPQNHEPHLRIAAIYLGRQALAPALAELEIALEKKPGDPNSLLARATTRRWQGQTEEALADINLVVNKLVPDRHDYLIERADLLRALGRDAEAIEDYQRCVTLQPKQTDGYLGLACVYERQGRLVLARECYERMIKADPTVPIVYLHRAEFLRNQGDYDAAIADCDLAAKIDTKSVLPELVRAGIMATRGNPVQAAKETEQLLERAPPHDGKVLYAAACALSLAAQAAQAQSDDQATVQSAQAYAKRAAEILADVAAGVCFHDFEYPAHNRMAWDPALAAIRDLPQVEKLLAGRK